MATRSTRQYLIETEGYGLEQFRFDGQGGLDRIEADRFAVETAVSEGAAFMTNGCPGVGGEPGCTRPYGSYRPTEAFRDYPFAPAAGISRRSAASLPGRLVE